MSENLTKIDQQINDLWSQGRFMEACSIIDRELIPILVDEVISHRGLAQGDAEDAVADAHHGFLKKISEQGAHSIATPKPYLWRAADRRAIDYGKKKKKRDIPESQLSAADTEEQSTPHNILDHQFHNAAGKGLIPSWQMRTTILVEGLIEDVEMAESDSAKLVRKTLGRLEPASAEIINHLLQHGNDQPAAQSARTLNLTANNFRVRKYRAYKEFRQVALQVAEELGIQWRGISEEQISEEADKIEEFLPPEDGFDEQQ